MKLTVIPIFVWLAAGLANPAYSDTDCDGWMTDSFFVSATPDAVRGCLESGADLHARDDQGHTPLHLAAGHAPDAAVVAELLIAGADPELTDKDGYRPLHVAAEMGQTPGNLSMLLAWGSDPDDRLPPVERCSWRSTRLCATSPLHLAAARADGAEYVAALIAADASLDLRDKDRRTPLHHAAKNAADVVSVALLIRAQATQDIRDFEGKTPLHFAAAREEGAPEIITALLEAGASADVGDENGTSPLTWAARQAPRSAIVATLVEAGGSPCAADDQGRTALSVWDSNDKLERDDVYWALHDACAE
jgi:ankyrin repeat protein